MIIDDVKALAVAVEPFGSRVTCNPPPMDTDEDWLVYQRPGDFRAENVVREAGGVRSDTDYLGGNVTSKPIRCYRLGELNIIFTDGREYFRRMMEATRLAKRFNLMDKADRVALFDAVVDREFSYEFEDERLEF